MEIRSGLGQAQERPSEKRSGQDQA